MTARCQQAFGGAWLHQPLFWLHFPKCGSSFRISTAAYQYSADRLVAVNHQTVGPRTRLDEVVAIFREPHSRQLSAYAWIHQARGKCCEDWGWDSSTHIDVSQRIAAVSLLATRSLGLRGAKQTCFWGTVACRNRA